VRRRFEQFCDELSGDDGSDGWRGASGAASAPILRRSTGFYRRHEASEDSEADDGRACEPGRLRSLLVVPDRAAVRRSRSPDDLYDGCKEPRRSAGRSQRGSTHLRRSGSRRSRRQRRGGGHGSSSADDSDGGCVVHSSRRQRIKPRTFDGSGSFETFCAHFENCATYNRWGEADKLAYLKASLVGDAGQVLLDSDASATDTLEKLTTLLRSRYSGSRQADKYRSELRLRRRGAGESLSTLHQDIRRLMALAHPTLQQEAREAIACDYLIDALDDADFALKVRDLAPPSLDEALRVALQLEAWAKDARRSRG